jgi:hypothetical protein
MPRGQPGAVLVVGVEAMHARHHVVHQYPGHCALADQVHRLVVEIAGGQQRVGLVLVDLRDQVVTGAHGHQADQHAGVTAARLRAVQHV